MRNVNRTLTGDITNFYSRVYLIDDRDSADMFITYSIDGGPFRNIPREWLSNESGDASLSVVGLVSPVAVDDLITGSVGSLLSVDVSLNDTDNTLIDKSSVSILENADAINEGVCSVGAAPDYMINFSPIVGFLGSAECIYRICDDENTCDAAKVVFNYE